MGKTGRIEIKGDAEYQALIKRFAKQAPERLDAALFDSATMVHSEAVTAIQSHQSSGRIYKSRTVEHTASAPGNPPNSDTGNLVNNISVKKIGKGYDVGSRKGAPYGVALEFGTSKMMARPWLVPSYLKAIERLKEKIKAKFR